MKKFLLLLLLLAAPLAADDLRTFNFRSVKNLTTGAESIPLCGPGGDGEFFNTSDGHGVSCIDSLEERGPEAWVAVGGSVFVETTCYRGWNEWANGQELADWRRAWYAATGRIPPIPAGYDAQCTVALTWQVFRKADMVYLGQTEGSSRPMIPRPTSFAPPALPLIPQGARWTPTAVATVASPGSTPTSAPPPPATAPPAPVTPPQPCPAPLRQLSDGGCACQGVRVPCEVQKATPVPTAAPTVASLPTSTPTTVEPIATPTIGPEPTVAPTVAVGSPGCFSKAKKAASIPVDLGFVALLFLGKQARKQARQSRDIDGM